MKFRHALMLSLLRPVLAACGPKPSTDTTPTGDAPAATAPADTAAPPADTAAAPADAATPSTDAVRRTSVPARSRSSAARGSSLPRTPGLVRPATISDGYRSLRSD